MKTEEVHLAPLYHLRPYRTAVGRPTSFKTVIGVTPDLVLTNGIRGNPYNEEYRITLPRYIVFEPTGRLVVVQRLLCLLSDLQTSITGSGSGEILTTQDCCYSQACEADTIILNNGDPNNHELLSFPVSIRVTDSSTCCQRVKWLT